MTKKPVRKNALTLRSNNGILRCLVSEVIVTIPFGTSGSGSAKANAIWDTGATNSVISKKIVTALKLKPIGKTNVNTANGSCVADVYLVNIVLPGKVGIRAVRVTEGTLSQCDMLVGMDVITLGDFSVTNLNGRTVMTFRVPSCHEIDYVKEIDRENKNNMLQKYSPSKKHKKKR